LLAAATLVAAVVPVVAAAATNQLWDFRAEDHLDPNRAHARVWVNDARVFRDVRFFAARDLRGPAALELSAVGFIVRGQPVCVWRRRPSVATSSGYGWVLGSVSSPDVGCPAGVPIRSFSQDPTWMFIELARVDGLVGAVAYDGAEFYFDLRPIVGRRWQSPWMLEQPRASPPLEGGVDIPRIFHPVNPRAPYSIVLRQAPSNTAPVVTTLTSTRYLDTFSLGEGALVASVYGRTERWSLLRLIDGRTGWIAPADSGKFVSAERLALRSDGMSDWDWTLAPAPGSTERRPVPRDPRRTWIGSLVRPGATDGSIPVFATPDRNAASIATWGDPNSDIDLVSINVDGTERPIVFSRRPGWFEVALERSEQTYAQESVKHVWIQDTPAGWSVVPVSPSEAAQLLLEKWPGGYSAAAEVVETRTINGELWLRVKVFAGEPCEHQMYSEQSWPLLGEGWTPAHNRFGRLVVWFETECD